MHKNTNLSELDVVKKFRVGDVVTTEYFEEDSVVVRVITQIIDNADSDSTRMISASDGGVCECCGRSRSKHVDLIDGAWFIPA